MQAKQLKLNTYTCMPAIVLTINSYEQTKSQAELKNVNSNDDSVHHYAKTINSMQEICRRHTEYEV